jgi:hypothetical protein
MTNLIATLATAFIASEPKLTQDMAIKMAMQSLGIDGRLDAFSVHTIIQD